jgi:hypothetical protein
MLFSSRYTVAKFSISFLLRAVIDSHIAHRIKSISTYSQLPEVIDMDRNPILPTSRNATAGGSNTSVLRPDKTIAFAFDIDGVLFRGNVSLPGTRQTLSMLQRYKVPFIFPTIGGELTETDHAVHIGHRLDLHFSGDQFVQCYMPFRTLAPQLQDATVLVLGAGVVGIVR